MHWYSLKLGSCIVWLCACRLLQRVDQLCPAAPNSRHLRVINVNNNHCACIRTEYIHGPNKHIANDDFSLPRWKFVRIFFPQQFYQLQSGFGRFFLPPTPSETLTSVIELASPVEGESSVHLAAGTFWFAMAERCTAVSPFEAREIRRRFFWPWFFMKVRSTSKWSTL